MSLRLQVMKDCIQRIEESVNSQDLDIALRRLILLELNVQELKVELQTRIETATEPAGIC